MWLMLAPANGKGNLQFFGNCKYCQNVETPTCGWGAIAGSDRVGTDPYWSSPMLSG